MIAILVRILSVTIAFLIAYYFRQEWLAIYLDGPSKFNGYAGFLLNILPMFLFMFYWRGVFSKSWTKKTLNSRISEGVLIHVVLVAIASMIAFYQQFHLFSRSFYALYISEFLFYAISSNYLSRVKESELGKL